MPAFRTRILLAMLSFPCFFSSALASRGVLKTDGIVYVRGQRGMDPRVTVIPFDAPAYVLPAGSTRFVLDLELDNSFLVTFEQVGCVTKQLYFDTTVPVEKHAAEFTFPFQVILEMQDAAHAFTYAGPVGFIRYHHEVLDFAYETNYTATVDPSFTERVAEIQRTGTDPLVVANVHLAARVVTSSYHRPNEEAPERVETAAMGTLAPMVAQVPRLVHRTGGAEEVAVLVVLVPIAPRSAASNTASPLPESSDRVPERAILPIVKHVAQLVERVIVAPKVAVVVLVVPLSERSPAVLAAPSIAPIVVARVARIIAPSISIGREEELVVDANRVTTIIRVLFPDGRSTEYRRVSNRWGAIYFFKDGLNVPEEMYAAGVAL